LGHTDTTDDQRNKVVHDQAGKYLLLNEASLFTVKEIQANVIFESSERCFNFPSHTIEFLQGPGRERLLRQIGQKVFIKVFFDLDLDDPEIDPVFGGTVIYIYIVKRPVIPKILINRMIFCFPDSPSPQDIMMFDVKL
jgi:hypothetical protein